MYEQNLTYARAIATAEHRIALGQTDVYIDSEWDFPFDKVTSVSSGGTYRLNIPSNIYLHFTEAGLSFRLSYELEERDANGAEQHRFDRARVRNLALKLAPEARGALAAHFKNHILPAVRERADEIAKAYNNQRDALDMVTGLIADVKDA
jgi:hypothetical protein